jgi:Tfp pilus assembly protein PilO
MGGTDRAVLIAVPMVAALIGFWFLVLAPKYDEASELQTQIDSLQSSIDGSEAQIAAAEQARDDFSSNYAQLVKLGRAVPETSDQATFVYEISEIGRVNDLVFQNFEVLADGSGGGTASPAPTAPSNGAEGGQATPAVATEAAAAALPIGATVGPAGLPVMPYEVTFRGNFFDIADFMADLDGTVRTGDRTPKVQGRLMTVDSFVLTGNPAKGFPSVQADLALTTYIIPPEQGIAAGATPAGPQPVPPTSPDPTVTSAVLP